MDLADGPATTPLDTAAPRPSAPPLSQWSAEPQNTGDMDFVDGFSAAELDFPAYRMKESSSKSQEEIPRPDDKTPCESPKLIFKPGNESPSGSQKPRSRPRNESPSGSQKPRFRSGNESPSGSQKPRFRPGNEPSSGSRMPIVSPGGATSKPKESTSNSIKTLFGCGRSTAV